MLVSKISFTSESNLLNKIQRPSTVEPQKAAPAELPKNNKVRNLSIGLGSAAVLIGLGVLGHNGKLGKGVQKLLGGVKKKTPEIIETVEEHINEIPKPEYSIKTTIPDVKSLADEFRYMDVSGFKDNYSKTTLPNGNVREIFLTVDGKRVARAFDSNSRGERVLEVQYINGEFLEIRNGDEIFNFRGDKLERYGVNKNGNTFSYNPQGTLTHIYEHNDDGKITRVLSFEEGTENIRNILYIDPNTNKVIKQDVFNDDGLID